jgi:hypothetical protein
MAIWSPEVAESVIHSELRHDIRVSIHHWIYRDTLDLAGEIKAAFGNDAEDLSATTLNDRIKIDTGNVRVTEDPSLTNIFRLDTVSLARAGDVRLS